MGVGLVGLVALTEPRCIVCGCTESQACITDRGACWWVNGIGIDVDLCSACFDLMTRPAVVSVLSELLKMEREWTGRDPEFWSRQFSEKISQLLFAGENADLREKAVQAAAAAIGLLEHLSFMKEKGGKLP